MATLAEAFDLAVSQYQGGQVDLAASICRQILAKAPEQPDTLHLLGVIEHNAGRNIEARQLIEKAIAVEGANPTFHLNLGIVLRALGNIEKAIEAYRQAVELDGQFAEALTNLCNMLFQEGRMTEAIDAGRRAVVAKPDLPQAHNNLANALKARGQGDEAIEHYRQALELNPDSAAVHRNLGNLLVLDGRHMEAIDLLGRAVAIEPHDAANFVGLALALSDGGFLAEARAACDQALSLNPVSADALIAMGNVLKDLGRPREAIEHYRRAIAIEPGRQIAHQNLLFTLNYLWDEPPLDIFARHVQWGRQVLASVPAPAKDCFRNYFRGRGMDRDPHRRLRVGYVSPDFRRHPVACFLLPILANHRPDEVEIFCYAQVQREDDVTQRCQTLAHQWINTCGLPDDELARRIGEDRIDVLVDLAGHTENSRLTVFARKPAPIQIAYLGYSNTTGLETVDYRLTDEVGDPSEPAGMCTPYVEKVVRLDAGFCIYEPPPDAPEVGSLPAERNGYVTFGSLTNPAKLNPVVFDLWGKVLHAVPQSRLLMNRDSFRGQVREDLINQFIIRGIARDRLLISHEPPAHGSRMAYYNDIDIVLDPFPYTGHTTNCEALWMGVPVVSLRGQTMIQRQAATILAAADCSQWLVDTHDAYLALATDLAADLPRLAAFRRGLRHRVAKSRLCDHAGFTHGLERTYRRLWRAWCADQVN